MTNSEFDVILNNVLERTKKTLSRKGTEYASTSDRLHNFKKAAHLQRATAEQALCGMMAKHLVSIYDMVIDQETYLADAWDEKIGDAINYLILLRALVVETKRCLGESSKSVVEPMCPEMENKIVKEYIPYKKLDGSDDPSHWVRFTDNSVCLSNLIDKFLAGEIRDFCQNNRKCVGCDFYGDENIE